MDKIMDRKLKENRSLKNRRQFYYFREIIGIVKNFHKTNKKLGYIMMSKDTFKELCKEMGPEVDTTPIIESITSGHLNYAGTIHFITEDIKIYTDDLPDNMLFGVKDTKKEE